MVTCELCGKTMRCTPSEARGRRYCSRGCYLASGLETGIERKVRENLEALGIAHAAQVQVGPWVVDFMLDNRLAIEADGTYWHSLRPGADKRKTDDLLSRGYTVWRFAEAEIRCEDFPAMLRRRLIDYEGTSDKLPRVAPDEALPFQCEDGMVGGQA